MPAMSAASGWPWPDIRWHEPQANLIPAPPVTACGAGGCSSGNQSGGFAFPATLAHSYSFALPGALTMPSGRTALGCTLSGMLNAQSGSPAGTVSASCALSPRAISSGASVHTRTAMRTDVSVRRITAGLLSHPRRRSAPSYPRRGKSYPGEGNGVRQVPQDPPGRFDRVAVGANKVNYLDDWRLHLNFSADLPPRKWELRQAGRMPQK